MQLPRQRTNRKDSEASGSHTRGGETVMGKNKTSEYRGVSTTLIRVILIKEGLDTSVGICFLYFRCHGLNQVW